MPQMHAVPSSQVLLHPHMCCAFAESQETLTSVLHPEPSVGQTYSSSTQRLPR